MVYQRERFPFTRAPTHRVSLFRVHRCRLLAQHSFASIERGQSHLQVRDGWRDDADQINVVACDYFAPIVRRIFNIELTRHTLRVLTMPARNRHDARILARAKGRNLRRAREACPDNADANEIFFGQLTPLLSEMMSQVWDVHRSYRAIASVVYLPPAGFEPTTLRL